MRDKRTNLPVVTSANPPILNIIRKENKNIGPMSPITKTTKIHAASIVQTKGFFPHLGFFDARAEFTDGRHGYVLGHNTVAIFIHLGELC